MNQAEPVITKYGVLNGRDAIYLDEISFSNGTDNTHIKGEFSLSLCSKSAKEKWLPYELTFERVLVIKVTELDTWESQQNWYNKSSFDLIKNSEWLSKLSGKKTQEHKHFIMLTYDDVIEVICESFLLEYGEPYS
ncbi:hypothetical protein MNBD_GAMMA10-2425 [hydrothermal vent metagenome]|uniref:Uncharacterized protein n=1 Tax=hydrothermal vent metagenome TaxID=652676 RepID=A0A3B0XL71_9ZZZZ